MTRKKKLVVEESSTFIGGWETALRDLVEMADASDGGAEDAARYSDLIRDHVRRLSVQTDNMLTEIKRLRGEAMTFTKWQVCVCGHSLQLDHATDPPDSGDTGCFVVDCCCMRFRPASWNRCRAIRAYFDRKQSRAAQEPRK